MPLVGVMALMGNWSVIALVGELARSSSWGYGLCGDLAMSSSWGYRPCEELAMCCSWGYRPCEELAMCSSWGFCPCEELAMSCSWGYRPCGEEAMSCSRVHWAPAWYKLAVTKSWCSGQRQPFFTGVVIGVISRAVVLYSQWARDTH